MPASPILQTGIFAAGLVLGIGATSILHTKRAAAPITPSAPPAPVHVPSPTIARGPVVDLNRNAAVGPGQSAGPVVFGDAAYEVSREVFKHGFPGPVPDILKRTAYVAAYDRRMRHPAWTAEHLTAASLMKTPTPTPTTSANLPVIPVDPYALSSSVAPRATVKGDRGRSQFMEDEEVPGIFRALMKDYFRSGYDRGHMVPAADAKSSQTAMDETFLLTNIAPQVGEGFNRHYWAYVEDFCRRLTGRFEDVYVFTVPLYLPSQGLDGKWRVSYEVIGTPPSISVPTHFAKVILTSANPKGTFGAISSAIQHPGQQRDLAIGAFVLPNQVIPDEVPLTQFVVPIEAVEKAAGLTLFSTQVKSTAKELCRETKCEVIIRRFDDAAKNVNGGQRGGQRPGMPRRNSL